MKNRIMLMLVIISVGTAVSVYAQAEQRGAMIHMPMMQGMMEKSSMVSSGDGGVIVMIGKTLYKYDKNLNLVKQIDLPVQVPQEKMTDMMGEKMGMTEKRGCSCGMGGTCGGQGASTPMQK